jgi:hypothetical protein
MAENAVIIILLLLLVVVVVTEFQVVGLTLSQATRPLGRVEV